jgi:serine/threonine-protein kinase
VSAPLDCPQVERWEALLESGLPPEERERYEQHLERCPACQERLDRAEDAGDPLSVLGRQVGDPTVVPADPTLVHVLERLYDSKGPDRAATNSPDLDFLRPAARPGLLGTLGSYEVEEVIGQGGMGIVLKAFDPALHRHVALKVLAPALAVSVTARRRFIREAQAAAAVRHEHVVTVHGVYEGEGLPYLVMQYVAGESLQARLNRAGLLGVPEIVRIGAETASGLAGAHAQGLIHRDVKPANILLEGGPARVKITDFGLARAVDDVGLTQSGVVAGTPEYMAPEQARGEPLDHRADLFSLGCVLYALGTGRPPFRGSTAGAVLRQVTDEAPAPLRESNPDIPAWLEALIMQTLAKDPAERFRSAAEVAALLEGYLAHLRQPTTVPPPPLPHSVPAGGPHTPGPGLRSRAPQWLPPMSVAAGLLLLAALTVGVGLWLAAGKDPEAAPKVAPAAALDVQFRAGLDQKPLHLFGPDVGQVARVDAQGLRFTLPAARDNLGMVGVELPARLGGDFEVTLGYEVLNVPNPGPPLGAGVQLLVKFDSPAVAGALVTRMQKTRGPTFGANFLARGPDGEEQFHGLLNTDAQAPKGRLRLARTGSKLAYAVADGDADIHRIQDLEVGTGDVTTVRVQCGTVQAAVPLDVRLIDLGIRADRMPKPEAIPANTPDDAPIPRQQGRSRAGLLAAAVLGVCAGLALLLGLGVWLRLRRRRRAEPAPPVVPAGLSFPCPGCSRNLRVRPGLAGKKVKCPQCGQGVTVPGGQPGAAGANP